ncbi:isochorismate synthase, chloroplastic-like isoform X2 [Magnolia sinica]|uniref:isochorismate synthase, chloroplastic-like isoform X2 n=1 Tax=Magnolia sinica TaxID=86752 RepID=UPI00265A6A5B|nr:isochorismate synthase, chloroplastic-like isoform X2 [Magnolia sinica]
MAAGTAVRSIAQLTAPDSSKGRFSIAPIRKCRSVSFKFRFRCLSMNGCGGDPESAVGVCETRTLPAVYTPEMALNQLTSAVLALKSKPPCFSSGIIRLEVPILEQIEAMKWLQAQSQLPRCFFSGRRSQSNITSHLLSNDDDRVDEGRVNGYKPFQTTTTMVPKLLSVAGIGSAVFFHCSQPFTFNDWRCIRRFLSKDCPLIRAYGTIRFDARTDIASEWEGFGSFYFNIPQVELDEFEGSSMLVITIAWDDTLLWSWGKAVDVLQTTLRQISISMESKKEVPRPVIISKNHIPNKASWDVAVKKALQMIDGRSSDLTKVVLARSTRVATNTDIDPLALLSSLKVEGQNSFQFCIQPPNAPAFIGNTPEQLFHRKHLNVSSEALAGTRARSGSKDLDLQIERDLLSSPKDHLEFIIVRESIKSKLEFDILSSIHPTPAVCGFPTEDARQFIAETEMFDRGMYAGPVGWFGGRESEFAVGIRSALVEKGLGMAIFAGVGIVKGTNPCSEWEELDLKASQFTKLIEMGGEQFTKPIGDEKPHSSHQEADSIGSIN